MKLVVNYLITIHSVPSSHPTDIQAVPLDATTLAISWNPPSSSTQNGIIIQYLLNVSTYETEQRATYVTNGSTTITINDLHPHYVYCIVIAAATSVGVGPYSEAESIRMPQDSKHLYTKSHRVVVLIAN